VPDILRNVIAWAHGRWKDFFQGGNSGFLLGGSQKYFPGGGAKSGEIHFTH